MATDVELLMLRIEASAAKLEKDMAKARGIVDGATKAMEDRVRRGSGMLNGLGRDGQAAFAKVGRGAKEATAALGDVERRAGAAGGAVSRMFGAADRDVRILSGNTANMAAQFQDVAVQAAAGTSAMTIALQQGTQLGAILMQSGGGLRGAVAGLGGALASVLSPINLVTIGLIAASAAAIQYFMTDDEADALTEALKRQKDVVDALAERYPVAGEAMKKAWTEGAAAVDDAVLTQMDALRAGLRASGTEAGQALLDGLTEYLSRAPGVTIEDLALPNDELAKRLREIAPDSADAEGFARISDALAVLRRESGPTAAELLTLREQMAAVKNSTAFSDDVRDLAAAFLTQTEGSKEAAQALVQLEQGYAASFVSLKRLMDQMVKLQALAPQSVYEPIANGFRDIAEWVTKAAEAMKVMNAENARFASESMQDWGKRYENLNEIYQRRAAGLPMGGSSLDNFTGNFLDLIGASEGTDRGRGYNESLGYGRFTGGPRNLVLMTLDQIDALQGQMLANPENTLNSSALGRYQITRTTLRSLRDQLGLDGGEAFSPEMQDRLAMELMRRRGNNPAALRQEWTSLAGVSDQVITGAFDRSSVGMPAADEATVAKRREAEAAVKSYEELIASGERFVEGQRVEAEAVGQTAAQAAKLRYEQQLLARAQQAGIELTPERLAAISELATRMAEAEDATPSLRSAQEDLARSAEEWGSFANGVAKGFVSDLLRGRDAADALRDALGRVLDKLANMALDSLLGVTSSNPGGWLGSLFGSLLGGVSLGSSVPIPTARPVPLADGGVVDISAGGAISGPGTSRSDSIDAVAADGTFVINAAAAKRHGPLLEALNRGRMVRVSNGEFAIRPEVARRHGALLRMINDGPRYAGGGMVGPQLARPVLPISGAETTRANGAMAGRIAKESVAVQVLPSPYFDVVVDHRAGIQARGASGRMAKAISATDPARQTYFNRYGTTR